MGVGCPAAGRSRPCYLLPAGRCGSRTTVDWRVWCSVHLIALEIIEKGPDLWGVGALPDEILAMDTGNPRTCTTGVASPACPITSDAAAASSSAAPTSVIRSWYPKRSFWPRRSTTPGTPASPIATPTVPSRQARPWESIIRTPSFFPLLSPRRWHRLRAVASGIFRQQQHPFLLRAAFTGNIGVIDPCIGTDKSQAVLYDHGARPGTQDRPGFL